MQACRRAACRRAGVQECRRAGVQACRGAGVQECRGGGGVQVPSTVARISGGPAPAPAVLPAARCAACGF